jgi:hypothetical protein
MASVSEFTSVLDIARRVADHLGQSRPITLSDPGKFTEIFNDIYPKIRQSELRRNVWRFSIRRAALRARDLSTRTLVPPNWSSTTGTVNPLGFYPPGCIVVYQGKYYVNDKAIPNSDTPGSAGSAWQRYFGPIDVSLWDPELTYYPGELVYKVLTNSTIRVFMAIQQIQSGGGDPETALEYNADTIYTKGQIVKYSGQYYYSNSDHNLGRTPGVHPEWVLTTTQYSSNWNEVIGATLIDLQGIYPLGSGPASQTFTRNAFRLPFGFLRRAPEDPKAGSVSILGAPSNVMYRDWDYEGDYIVTRDSGVILLRFVADITDVAAFDPMFAEGLAARIAIEMCEAITQSTERLKNLSGFYTTKMREARLINGIEIGADMPPVDDWISCRL